MSKFEEKIEEMVPVVVYGTVALGAATYMIVLPVVNWIGGKWNNYKSETVNVDKKEMEALKAENQQLKKELKEKDNFIDKWMKKNFK
jgi:hypothetical protein